MFLLHGTLLAALLIGFVPAAVRAQEVVQLALPHGEVQEALLYDAAPGRAAVLVHQSGATMESWDAFARVLQERDLTVLSLSKSTRADVRAAVDRLTRQGQQEIALIGASIGGAAILQTLARETPQNVRHVVLLAPATGPELTAPGIAKLVLVAKADFFKDRAYGVFEEASVPKTLIEFDGSDHGQALLEGEHAEAALTQILTFLNLEPER